MENQKEKRERVLGSDEIRVRDRILRSKAQLEREEAEKQMQAQASNSSSGGSTNSRGRPSGSQNRVIITDEN